MAPRLKVNVSSPCLSTSRRIHVVALQARNRQQAHFTRPRRRYRQNHLARSFPPLHVMLRLYPVPIQARSPHAHHALGRQLAGHVSSLPRLIGGILCVGERRVYRGGMTGIPGNGQSSHVPTRRDRCDRPRIRRPAQPGRTVQSPRCAANGDRLNRTPAPRSRHVRNAGSRAHPTPANQSTRSRSKSPYHKSSCRCRPALGRASPAPKQAANQ